MTEGLAYEPPDNGTAESGPLNRAEALNLLIRAGHDYRNAENVLTGTADWANTGKPKPIGAHSVLFLHTTGRWYIEGPAAAPDDDLDDRSSPAAWEARWLSQIRDIAASRLVTDAQAGGRIRALLFPQHVHDDDDGTVEGCPGCFPPGEAIPRSGPGWDYGPDWPAGTHGQAPGPEDVYRDLDGTRDALRAIGYPEGGIRQAVEHAPFTTAEDIPSFLSRHTVVYGGDVCGGEGGYRIIDHGEPPPRWPELGTGWDVAEICAAIRLADAHLDANTAPAYRDQPLAGHGSRITKAVDEAVEAKDALAGVTGENPRKGVCDTWEHVMEELGDTACAALFGIQHITKDPDVTWAVFIAALSKALSRVPQERPAPITTTEGDNS